MVTSRAVDKVRRSDLGAILGGNVIVLLLGIGTSVLGARALGPGERGAFFAVQGTAAIVAVACSLGLPQVLVTTKASLGDLWRALLPALFLGLGAGALLAWAVSVSSDRESTPAAILGGALFVGGSVAGAFGPALAQRLQLMRGPFQVLRIAPVVAMLVAMSVLFMLGSTASQTWLLVCGGTIFVTNIVGLLAYFGPQIARGERTGRLARGFWAHALASLSIAAGSQLLYRGDVLVVSFMDTLHNVGIYSVAVAVGSAVSALGQAVGMRAYSRTRTILGDPRKLERLFRSGLRQSLVLASVVACAAMAVVPVAIPLLYGTNFDESVVPALLLAAAAVPMSVDYFCTHVGFAVGMKAKIFTVQAVAVAMQFAALVIVVPVIGPVGAALTCAIVYSATSVCLFVLISKHLQLARG